VAGLLDQLEPDHQWLVDLVAEAYDADGEWPVFDFLEAGGRAVVALAEQFNLAHPIVDPAGARAVITSGVVGALTPIREELAANF
jgi:hypothetical protein